jgi:hypothetical protein
MSGAWVVISLLVSFPQSLSFLVTEKPYTREEAETFSDHTVRALSHSSVHRNCFLDLLPSWTVLYHSPGTLTSLALDPETRASLFLCDAGFPRFRSSLGNSL